MNHHDQIDRSHFTRLDYPSFTAALTDAIRVLDDLAAIGAGQLLVPADQLDFTLRRSRELIAACIQTAREAGIEP
ncbi:hypothetical protein [Nocardioides sp. GY 10127]|uniref:hypothetical protein n=1 Tax=Nocardioides sp. GY 10127 TaxID=2569762 RepID=UPI0010A86EA6|nr:hypothetical protein [Nocardioides sp. GY 10127]TIC84107.1 hypothetical protein E8D37_04680 [Nocardioides sp. GY 10127]